MKFYKEHKQLDDELSKDLIAMQLKLYESDVAIKNLIKEKRIRELEKKNYEIIFLGGISIILIVLVIGIITFFKFYKRNNKKFEQKKIELLKVKYDKNKIYDNYLKKERDNNELSSELDLKSNKLQELFLKLKEKNSLLNDVLFTLDKSQNKNLITKLSKAKFTKEELIMINQELTLMNNSFHKNLLLDYPNLTMKDLKLASLLKINMSSKEIADILYISSSSVDVSRSRLRKKMNLNRTDSLKDILSKY